MGDRNGDVLHKYSLKPKTMREYINFSTSFVYKNNAKAANCVNKLTISHLLLEFLKAAYLLKFQGFHKTNTQKTALKWLF